MTSTQLNNCIAENGDNAKKPDAQAEIYESPPGVKPRSFPQAHWALMNHRGAFSAVEENNITSMISILWPQVLSPDKDEISIMPGFDQCWVSKGNVSIHDENEEEKREHSSAAGRTTCATRHCTKLR